MADKDKNFRKDLSDFLRYRDGSLTESERNAFERELQKDPFAAEAEEGFSDADPDSIRMDMELLSERLRKRTKEKSRFLIYRFAASLAIIMGIAAVFVITERSRKTGISESQPEPFTIAESRPLEKQNAGPQESDDISPPSPSAKTENEAVVKKDKIETTPFKPVSRAVVADTLLNIIAEVEPVQQPVIAREAEALAEAVAATSVTDAPKGRTYTRRAEVLNEAGAEVAGIEETDKKSTDLSTPQPSAGMEAFKKYIRENIRLPEGFKAWETMVVELSFIVRSDGPGPIRLRLLKAPESHIPMKR